MVTTRFAPSPTGMLHIGSVRTALYCWLYARHTNGKFVLRIEDTDRERSTEEALQVILEGLNWLGLNWDEGPIYQTKRFDRYQQAIQQLLETGQAYKCYCSKERLENLRGEQMKNKEKPRYDGRCRDALHIDAEDKSFVVRFKNPESGKVLIEDAIRGTIEIDNQELDDLILLRSDGTPTYNLTVVVDDWDMGITHVLRGDDHINNTPRQINLLKALGAPLPIYGHMPMLLSKEGKKLSKRSGAASILDYQEDGILPKALLNYLVRLGWSHGDQEIFSISEMIEFFDIKDINSAPSALNEEKLLWLNQHYLKTLPTEEIVSDLTPHFEKMGVSLEDGPDLKEVIIAQRERCKTLKEMAEKSRFFYQEIAEYEEKAQKHLKPDNLPILQAAYEDFSAVNNWEPSALHACVEALCEKLDLKLGKIAQPLRVAMTGNTISPPIDITLTLIGKTRVLERLEKAIAFMER